MSKKKINKRLDKLFDDINKENETPAEVTQKKPKPVPPLVEFSADRPESIFEEQFATFTDRTTATENVSIAPSTMLSTAFRTDENSWATLKVVDESDQRKWGSEEQMLVKQVADQLSLALENARLFQEAQRRAREMTAIAEVGREISATLELQKVLDRIAAQTMITLNTVTSAVYIPDAEFKKLIAITALGAEADEIKNDPLIIGQGILGNIALNKKGMIANDASNNPLAITIQGTDDRPDEHLMATPILSQQKLNGLLAVWRVGSGQDFTLQEFEFLESLAQQAAIAVENARLFEETRKRTEQLAILNEIITSASQSLDLKATLTIVLEKVLQITGFDGGLITMFNETRGKLERAVRIGMPGQSPADPAQGLEGSLCENVFRTSKAMVIEDLSTGVPEGINAKGDIEAGLRGYIGVPIETKGRTLGTLCLFRYALDAIPNDMVGLVQTVSGQLGFSIENATLFDQTQERAEELSVLNEMARELSTEMNITRLCETAYKFIGRLIDTTNFFIAIYDEKNNMLSFPLTINNTERIENSSRPLGKGLTDYIIRFKVPLLMPDNIPAHMEKIGVEFLPLGDAKPAQCWLGVPLMLGNKATGAIVVQSVDTPRIFNEADQELLVTVASQVSIALENARLFNEAQARARREKILREITAHIRATNDPEMIAKTAVRELGQALSVSAFIHVGSEDTLNQPAAKKVDPESKDNRADSTKQHKRTAKGGK